MSHNKPKTISNNKYDRYIKTINDVFDINQSSILDSGRPMQLLIPRERPILLNSLDVDVAVFGKKTPILKIKKNISTAVVFLRFQTAFKQRCFRSDLSFWRHPQCWATNNNWNIVLAPMYILNTHTSIVFFMEYFRFQITLTPEPRRTILVSIRHDR